MKQALVSGAGGFIGQRLTALLREAGVAVATIGRGGGQLPGHATVAGQWTARHWRQALSASQPDIVFHLAGAISGTPDEFEQVNVGIARDLFQALRETGARPAVVLAGSAAEYGETVIDGVPVDEALECAPVSLYGKSKFAQTKAGLAFAEETGIRVLIARFFNVIGPGMSSHLALGDFAGQIAAFPRSGGTLVTGNLDVNRDLIDVDSAALAMLALAGNPMADGIVNVCSGRADNIGKLVEAMIGHSGKAIKVVLDPKRLRPGERRVIIGGTRLQEAFGAPVTARNSFEVVPLILEHAERDHQSRHAEFRQDIAS